MQFCNITISHSRIPYDILDEMFTLERKLLHPYHYPTNHTQAGVTSPGSYRLGRLLKCLSKNIEQSKKYLLEI